MLQLLLLRLSISQGETLFEKMTVKRKILVNERNRYKGKRDEEVDQ